MPNPAPRNEGSSSRYMIISGDSHVGPSVERDLRPYCPASYLEPFDEFAKLSKAGGAVERRMSKLAVGPGSEAFARSTTCLGLQDAKVFLSDMDGDGIVASVIFAGGGNNEAVPWITGMAEKDGGRWSPELATVGARIWNEWLVDFTSADPNRLIGTAQLALGDIEGAVKEVYWAADHGLKVVNFPAPRPTIEPYNSDAYEPFWHAVAETGVALLTHGATGDVTTASEKGFGYNRIFSAEVMWLSRRSLAQMIFGGVFERHPQLRLVFTEQRSEWAGETLDLFESVYADRNWGTDDLTPRSPREYWSRNCFIAASFMAPYEVARRYEAGIDNLLWGSDYPHPEGTWPNTSLSLRNTFHNIPEADVRKILGENAINVYGLDRATLRDIADRIGPLPEEIAVPITPEDVPAFRGFAFRESGQFS